MEVSVFAIVLIILLWINVTIGVSMVMFHWHSGLTSVDRTNPKIIEAYKSVEWMTTNSLGCIFVWMLLMLEVYVV